MSQQCKEDWENEGGRTLSPRIESSMFSKRWGKQTEKCLKYFNIGDDYFDHDFLSVLITIKKVMAKSNQRFGLINPILSKSIIEAVDFIFEKKDFSCFPTKIWQTGSGTGVNMNVNEVIATIANSQLEKILVHPNDHVNMCQSSNDIIPTALNIVTTKLLIERLIPELKKMEIQLKNKEREFQKIIKVGRTHLMDAVPMSLGQEFSAFKSQIKENIKRLEDSVERLKLVPLGGTAIGTGINCPTEVSDYAIEEISKIYDIQFEKMENLFSGISSSDSIVELSGQLKTLACSLLKIATDITILSSGPNAGIGEIIFPNNESGSSIMPGKVNPTQCEALSMVCCQVIGNDTAITLGGMQGKLQLNTFRPLLIKNMIQSINLLADSIRSFNDYCLKGLKENKKNIETYLHKSKMGLAAITPSIGYDQAALLVKNSTKNKTSIGDEIITNGYLSKEEVKRKLEPKFLIHSPLLRRLYE
jgi:fumarate hydratase, class II